MATARRKSPKVTAPSTPAPIVLSGPPGQLRSTVTVENTAAERVAVRGLALHRAGHPTVTGAAAALIPPGTTATVPVSFALDPATAPGDYEAEVEVGGLRRPAVLRVEQHLSMRVSPRRVLAAPGRQPVELTVTNEGNADVTLAALARARTDDGGPDPGPDVSLTLEGAVTVPAASSLSLHAQVDVPDGLDPARRHTARVPVGLADLDVIILPRTASESSS